MLVGWKMGNNHKHNVMHQYWDPTMRHHWQITKFRYKGKSEAELPQSKDDCIYRKLFHWVIVFVIPDYLIGVNLTIVPEFHSHLEPLWKLDPLDIHNQVTPIVIKWLTESTSLNNQVTPHHSKNYITTDLTPKNQMIHLSPFLNSEMTRPTFCHCK